MDWLLLEKSRLVPVVRTHLLRPRDWRVPQQKSRPKAKAGRRCRARFFPLGFGGKPSAAPSAIRVGILPANIDDRVVGSGCRAGAVGLTPVNAVGLFGPAFFSLGLVASGRNKGSKAGVGNFVAVDGKGAQIDLAAGLFVGGSRVVDAHGEGPGWHDDLFGGNGCREQQGR